MTSKSKSCMTIKEIQARLVELDKYPSDDKKWKKADWDLHLGKVSEENKGYAVEYGKFKMAPVYNDKSFTMSIVTRDPFEATAYQIRNPAFVEKTHYRDASYAAEIATLADSYWTFMCTFVTYGQNNSSFRYDDPIEKSNLKSAAETFFNNLKANGALTKLCMSDTVAQFVARVTKMHSLHALHRTGRVFKSDPIHVYLLLDDQASHE